MGGKEAELIKCPRAEKNSGRKSTDQTAKYSEATDEMGRFYLIEYV